MYSLAPAWIAATAARASVEVPQATTGTVMCSASSRVIRSRMSTATSTIRRSAPRPERSTRSAISAPSAWVTVAPFSMASLVASVSWPWRVPTIRRRIVSSPSSYSLAAAEHGRYLHRNVEYGLEIFGAARRVIRIVRERHIFGARHDIGGRVELRQRHFSVTHRPSLQGIYYAGVSPRRAAT